MKSLKNKFFFAFLFVFFIGLFAPLLIGWQKLHHSVIDDLSVSNRRELTLLSEIFIDKANISYEEAIKYLENFAKLGSRVTFMNEDGRVLFDSNVPANQIANLDNHANRLEIKRAKEFGTGATSRYSDTLQIDFVYAAQKIEKTKFFPAGFLRTATATTGLSGKLNNFIYDFSFVILLVIGFAFFLSQYLYRRIESAISQVKQVLDNTAIDGKETIPALPQRPEFTDLVFSVAQMSQRVNNQLHTVITQKSELRSILNTLKAGLMFLDERGSIVRLNAAFEKLLPEYFPNNTLEVLGKRPLEVFNNVTLEELIQETYQKNDEAFSSCQLSLNSKVFQVDIAKPQNSENIKADISLVLVFYEITQLVNMIDIKKDFVANVSHELRTPLTAINGFAETLQELIIEPDYVQNNKDKIIKFLSIIIKNTKHLDCIVSELLALSHLENSEISIENARCILGESIEFAIEECQKILDEKKISIEKQINPHLELAIDDDRLIQVLRNLIENAIKYAPENSSIIIHQEVSEDITGKKYCKIYVQDFGVGIPQQELNRVFERFYRVEKDRANSTTSTGLGLSICKHIIEKYSGSIYAIYHADAFIQTANQVGATILFTLPLHIKK